MIEVDKTGNDKQKCCKWLFHIYIKKERKYNLMADQNER